MSVCLSVYYTIKNKLMEISDSTNPLLCPAVSIYKEGGVSGFFHAPPKIFHFFFFFGGGVVAPLPRTPTQVVTALYNG